jgi:membrane protein YdbS with pleckstrin-like domain
MSNEHSNDPGHGDSVAAWTAVIIVVIASIVATFAYYVGNTDYLYASAALAAFGVVAGVVLSKIGFGVKRSK